MTFDPPPGLRIDVPPATYAFAANPALPPELEDVYVIEGGEALTYQVTDVETGTPYALKVPKGLSRGRRLAQVAELLATYAELPGLYLARRICLTQREHPALLRAYPELEYATLMPWLNGQTWSGLLQDPAASEAYMSEHALQLALVTAQVLWNLEAHALSHTDVAGGNIVLAPTLREIELLDLENVRMPGMLPPPYRCGGSPGYQHRRLGPEGQWSANGDRFAAAVVLAEMLSWWDPAVRALTPPDAESVFAPDELQEQTAPRWQAVRDALWTLCPPTLELFDAAWASDSLEQCPDLGSWAMALVRATQTRTSLPPRSL